MGAAAGGGERADGRARRLRPRRAVPVCRAVVAGAGVVGPAARTPPRALLQARDHAVDAGVRLLPRAAGPARAAPGAAPDRVLDPGREDRERGAGEGEGLPA